MAYYKPACSHWRRKFYRLKDKVAAAGVFSLVMKLHPDFLRLHVNSLKSHIFSMKISAYILYSVWVFWLMQSWRCHLDSGWGFSTIPCAERSVIIQGGDVIFSGVQLLQSGFSCAEISILTIRMHTNTLIIIIMCLGAPPERLDVERIDVKSRSGWKNPDNDGWQLNQQAAICGTLLLSFCLPIHNLLQ